MKLQGIESEGVNIVIRVSSPNQVTDSKHARVLKGMAKMIFDLDREIKSPFDLAYEYLNLLAGADETGTVSYMISESLGKFPITDFYRFGDRNCVKDVSRSWFNEKGISLDVQSEILMDIYHRYFDTDMLIDHVMSHKPGQYAQPLEAELNHVMSEFFSNYNVKLTPSYANFLVGLTKQETKKDNSLPF